MSARLPYFDAIQDGYLYRVFVTSSDVICVRLGKGFIVERKPDRRYGAEIYYLVGLAALVVILGVFAGLAFILDWGRSVKFALGGGFIGGLLGAARSTLRMALSSRRSERWDPGNTIDEAGRFEAGVKEDLKLLDRFDADGIRDYVREKKRGYAIGRQSMANARIDYLGKWRRIYLGSPMPAFIAEHPSKGRIALVFRKRADVVIGMFELENLLGDNLEIALDMEPYEKALKKYEKMRKA